jgi:3-deoxy-7-phosphoheptulonate synthase
VIIVVHPEPNTALCDGDQALVDSDLRQLASVAANLPPLMGRTLTPPLAAPSDRQEDRRPSPVAG